MSEADHPPVGAIAGDGSTRFTVWAPYADRVDVHITSPFDKTVTAERIHGPVGPGYHEAIVDGAEPGARYRLRLDDRFEHPDPASRSQPEGVHGDSEVVAPRSRAGPRWDAPALRDYVIYECHIGAFTREGTFDSAIAELDRLVDLGVTALEVMPIAQFPGGRNWGYDGVYPYAAQSTYGGPDAFARLVDACHGRGLAVVLDVVYNHFGPEGCYVDAFGPYFTDRYRTPWGRAINFDGPGSDEVRRFFIGNALYWLEELDVDALRLDAVHAIADTSAYPFIEELGVAVSALDGPRYLIAESADNDIRLITPRDRGGLGMDAQWNDDFHHALSAVVTGATDGYFADHGAPEDVATAFERGFVYQGQYSTFRGRRHGRPAPDITPERLVVFAHNHDQIGNRPAGDRLTTRGTVADLQLMAAAVLLSPFVPLLFMGEEYGERAPFPYFVSHSDADLVEAVRRGRRAEFASFSWAGEPPDPQSEATFDSAKLDPSAATTEPHTTIASWYAELLRLRRELTPITQPSSIEARVVGGSVCVEMRNGSDGVAVVLDFGGEIAEVDAGWSPLLDSADDRWSVAGHHTDHSGRRRTRVYRREEA